MTDIRAVFISSVRSQRDDFQSDGSEKKTLEREKEEKGRTSPISGEFADNMETHTVSSLTWDLSKSAYAKGHSKLC